MVDQPVEKDDAMAEALELAQKFMKVKAKLMEARKMVEEYDAELEGLRVQLGKIVMLAKYNLKVGDRIHFPSFPDRGKFEVVDAKAWVRTDSDGVDHIELNLDVLKVRADGKLSTRERPYFDPKSKGWEKANAR